MKKLLPLIPFAGTLAMTILTIFMYALTGDMSMVVLFPFCIAVLLITHDNLLEQTSGGITLNYFLLINN